MKGFERMKEMENMINKYGVARMAAVALALLGIAGSAFAATGAREDHSRSASGTVFRPSMRHAAAMQPLSPRCPSQSSTRGTDRVPPVGHVGFHAWDMVALSGGAGCSARV